MNHFSTSLTLFILSLNFLVCINDLHCLLQNLLRKLFSTYHSNTLNPLHKCTPFIFMFGLLFLCYHYYLHSRYHHFFKFLHLILYLISLCLKLYHFLHLHWYHYHPNLHLIIYLQCFSNLYLQLFHIIENLVYFLL